MLESSLAQLVCSWLYGSPLLKPAGQQRSVLAPFYGWFNRVFDAGTRGYLGLTGFLVRKEFRSMVFVGIVVALALGLGTRVPSGFIPEEDQGFFIVAVQLPDAASLERTDAACRKV